MALAPLIRNYILTDQAYVMKLLNQNLSENDTSNTRRQGNNSRSRKGLVPTTVNKPSSNITTKVLDWEVDEVTPSLPSPGDEGFDAIIVCDCIYNDALIQPLVQTCIDACQLRRVMPQSPGEQPTLCIIAQQLRSDQVFDSWLIAFHKAFHVWRLPDSELTAELRSNTGFVVHCGFLR
jgi:Lysine methyltransferase